MTYLLLEEAQMELELFLMLQVEASNAQLSISMTLHLGPLVNQQRWLMEESDISNRCVIYKETQLSLIIC